jgi:hypothetical protein
VLLMAAVVGAEGSMLGPMVPEPREACAKPEHGAERQKDDEN